VSRLWYFIASPVASHTSTVEIISAILFIYNLILLAIKNLPLKSSAGWWRFRGFANKSLAA
jgi:hypothetical protein